MQCDKSEQRAVLVHDERHIGATLPVTLQDISAGGVLWHEYRGLGDLFEIQLSNVVITSSGLASKSSDAMSARGVINVEIDRSSSRKRF